MLDAKTLYQELLADLEAVRELARKTSDHPKAKASMMEFKDKLDALIKLHKEQPPVAMVLHEVKAKLPKTTERPDRWSFQDSIGNLAFYIGH